MSWRGLRTRRGLGIAPPLWLAVCLAGQGLAAAATTAFVDVAVVPMDREGILRGQTVVVEGDRIVSIGPNSAIVPPAGAAIVDGTGAYLVPGLVDAHVHLEQRVGCRPDFGDAPLYLAHGVTTVFNLRGEPEHLAWRDRIRRGELVAPTIFTASEFVNEPRVRTVGEVEREVERHRREGYELIKFREVYDHETHRVVTTAGLSPEPYRRLLAAAREAGIPLVGHAPYRVGLNGLLENRQSLAHVNELANLHFLPPLDLSRGPLLLVAKWSCLALLTVALLWNLAALAGPPRTREVRRAGIVALALAIAATTCAVLWLLTVPPGLAFGNVPLLAALSALAFVVLVGSVASLVLAVRLWLVPRPQWGSRAAAALATAAALAFAGTLFHWVPFAWRGTDAAMNRVASELRAAGVWVQSTLLLQEEFVGARDGFRREQLAADPNLEFLDPGVRDAWRAWARRSDVGAVALWRRHPEFNRRLAGALYRAGVPLMAGTDAMGAPLVVPGASLHVELEQLAESGLDPAAVLRTATVGPARFVGHENEFGTIAAGKRADLVLVDGDPLADLSRLRRPLGVMVRGRWLPRDELDRMLAALRDGAGSP